MTIAGDAGSAVEDDSVQNHSLPLSFDASRDKHAAVSNLDFVRSEFSCSPSANGVFTSAAGDESSFVLSSAAERAFKLRTDSHVSGDSTDVYSDSVNDAFSLRTSFVGSPGPLVLQVKGKEPGDSLSGEFSAAHIPGHSDLTCVLKTAPTADSNGITDCIPHSVSEEQFETFVHSRFSESDGNGVITTTKVLNFGPESSTVEKDHDVHVSPSSVDPVSTTTVLLPGAETSPRSEPTLEDNWSFLKSELIDSSYQPQDRNSNDVESGNTAL
ncbi:unnamed protein product [Echinostoma caproni]|uniref:Uncharacterized protein n=1 Tax=Echinostoma caproni TaxID=27848 RepID=A0A183APD1_9TREM|nr:unnamed protein product [Echinostoma caproni]